MTNDSKMTNAQVALMAAVENTPQQTFSPHSILDRARQYLKWLNENDNAVR